MKGFILTLATLVVAFCAGAKSRTNIVDASDSIAYTITHESADIQKLCDKMSIKFTDDDSDVTYRYTSESLSLEYTKGKVVALLGDVTYHIYDTSNTEANYIMVSITSFQKEVRYFGPLSEDDDASYFQAQNIHAQNIEQFLKDIRKLKLVLKRILEKGNGLTWGRFFNEYFLGKNVVV